MATYRGLPVEGFSPDEALPYAIHPLMSPEERHDAEGLRWTVAYYGFRSAVQRAIMGYWEKQLGLKIDPVRMEAEKRAICAKWIPHLFDGKMITAEKVRKRIENQDMDSVLWEVGEAVDVALLWLYQKDEKGADLLYEQYFKQRIRPQEWARLKREHGAPHAFRSYAFERIAACLEERFQGMAEEKLREKQMAEALVSRKVIAKPEDFQLWLQSELVHVQVVRGDVLPVFVDDSPLPKAGSPK